MRNYLLRLNLILALVSPINLLLAYEANTTHAGLSQEIVSFFNYFYKTKITDSQKELIIQGSVDEDIPEKRVFNHFYDPIRNIGLNNYFNSKQWGGGEVLENQFSWLKAIDYYAHGDEDKAYLALGHVLHLLEDASVPDHTRNDPHTEFTRKGFKSDSPFESWAANNKNRQTLSGLGYTFYKNGLRPKIESNIGGHFDFMAKYSNNNFFSKDTINNSIYQYENPKIQEVVNGYAYRTNEENKKVKLLISKEDISGNEVQILVFEKDESVLAEYFDELSKQIIPVGAGVIDLFLKEGEAAREKYRKEEAEMKLKKEADTQTEEKIQAAIEKGSKFGKAIYWTQYTWKFDVKRKVWSTASRIKEKFEGKSAVLAQSVPNILNAIGFTSNVVTKTGALAVAENVETLQKNYVTFVQKQNPATLLVGPIFASSKKTPKTITPEIIEIENEITVSPVNGVVVLEIAPVSLPPRPFFSMIPGYGGGGSGKVPDPPVQNVQAVVESISQEATTTALEVAPEENEKVEEVEEIIDTTPPEVLSVLNCYQTLAADSCFIATSTVALTWSSDSTDVANYAVSIDGVLSSTSTETSAELSLIEGSHEIKVIGYDNNGNAGTSTEVFVEYMLRPIVVSEIAWAGTEESSLNEWVELFNRSNHSIDLTNIRLRALDGTPDMALSGIIAPQTYFLIESSDDGSVPTISADLALPFSGSSGSGLSNEGEDLFLIQSTNMTEVILDRTPATEICEGWCEGIEGSFSTMTRININGDGSGSANWATDVHYVKRIFDEVGVKIRGSPKGPIENECLINHLASFSSPTKLKMKSQLAVVTIIIDPCEQSTVGEI